MAFPINPSPGDTYTDAYGTVWVYAGSVNGWYRKTVFPVNDTTYIGSDGAPGGAGGNTQVVFNDNGSLAGDSGLTYNKTSDTLTSSKYTASLGTNTAPSFYFGTDTNTGIYSPGADQLAISTNGTGRLFVDASGNAKFTQPIIATKSDGTTTAGQIARSSLIITSGSQDDLGIATTGHLRIATGGSAETFRFTSDGKLGLGTSSPSAKLHIASGSSGATPSVNADDLFIETNGNTGITIGGSTSSSCSIRFADSASSSAGGIYYDHSTDAFDFATAANNRLRIDSSGRVGIGTTTPGEDLSVSGAVSSAGVIGINGNSGQVSRLQFKRANTNRFKIECSTTDDLIFYSDASTAERARIDSSGYLRLSANSPGIQFNGDTAAANALDDYEEGTFTPSVRIDSTSGTTITLNNDFRTLRYVKVGRAVFIQGRLTSNDTPASGTLISVTLPFAPIGTAGGQNYTEVLTTRTGVTADLTRGRIENYTDLRISVNPNTFTTNNFYHLNFWYYTDS